MNDFSEDPPVDPSIDPDLIPPEPIAQVHKTEDRRIVGELVDTEEDLGPFALELDPEEKIDFSRLINVGRRIKVIEVADHRVTIQTLKVGDEMRIGLYTKPYLDSQGFSRAYQIGVCAAGLVEIENQPLWSSFKEITSKDEKFAKNCEALAEFYPLVLTQIFTAIMDTEREYTKLALKLGKLGKKE